MNADLALAAGQVSAGEAALCRLLAANVQEFGSVCVDTVTMVDVMFGVGTYGCLAPETAVCSIFSDYEWTYVETVTPFGTPAWRIYGK